MTTVDGESHLFAFGEFAALYVMVWSNACWPLPGRLAPRSAPIRIPERRCAAMPPDIPRARARFDKLWPKDVRDKTEGQAKTTRNATDRGRRSRSACCAGGRRSSKRAMRRSSAVAEFYRGLPKVRRALANVPTYMIFDDHDVTDDWNLNPIWVDRVNNTTLGRTILRNALASLRGVPGLGQRSVRYLNERNDTGPAGDPQRMLQTIEKMFRRARIRTQTGRNSRAAGEGHRDALDKFFGLDLRPQPTASTAARPP